MGADVLVFLFDAPKYERELLPSYRNFMQKADTTALISLLESAISRVSSRHENRGLMMRPAGVYEEYSAILKGSVYYSSGGEEPAVPSKQTSPADMKLLVERSIAPALLRALCVPATTDFRPVQDLSTTGLTRFLFEHSQWIEDYLTFAKEPSGSTPEITLGEWSRLFSNDEVRSFDAELSQMLAPVDPDIAEQFNNLRGLVHAAASKATGFALLLCIA